MHDIGAGVKRVHKSIIMPPPANDPCLHLDVLAQTFYVKKYGATDEVPLNALRELSVPKTTSGIISITRTAEEISIICEAKEEEGEWKCIKIAGPMEFGSYSRPVRLSCALTT